LHWQLDVSFREDVARNRKDNGPGNIAVLRRRACLMTLGAFVRNKSRRSTFWNADLRWWLDRHALGL
jgi:hypothetical protein